MWTRLRNKLRYLVSGRRMDRELAQELEFHREMLAEDAERAGGGAALDARRRMGNTTLASEDAREAWSIAWIDTLARDVRYCVRSCARTPGFTATAVLTLALGIGANTAMFSVVHAVLLHPLAYRDPDRLVRIFFNNPGVGLRDVPFSVPELEDLRTRSGVFDDVSALVSASVNVTGAKHPERLELLGVSPNYFSMLGAAPQIGRLAGPQDFAMGLAPVVVVSDALWRRSYGGDLSVLGRSVRLDNDLYTIVGVLPPGFRHPGRTISRDVEVWVTGNFSADPFPTPARSTRVLPAAIGRLKPGVTPGQAQSRLDALALELRREFANDYPAGANWTIEIQPLQESLVGNVRPMLLLLLSTVVLIVFIVCLNMGGLLLARASGRQQEVAVRSALGASRSRIVRQMLTESVLLSVVGGTVGIATAVAMLGDLLRFVPANIPRLNEVRIDWVVLAFALLLSVVTGLLFGLVPAIHSTRSTLSSATREGSRGSGDSATTTRVRDALIVSELALAVVLMVGAGLLLRTLLSLLSENPGFNPHHVVAANLWLPVPNDPKTDPYLTFDQQITFDRELLRRMKAIPGVELAAVTSSLPAANQANSAALVIEDRPVESSRDLRGEIIRVSPDYFRVMEAPLAGGRPFTERDENGKQPVAIIDQATARRYWADRDPIGRRLRIGQNPARPWLTVVGVVSDIKNDGLDVDGVPHVYVPIYQSLGRTLSVVVRTSLPATLLEAPIRAEIENIDPGLPVFDIASMNDVIDASLASRRFSANLVVGFAALAVLLASIGIYGLLTYMVGQRTRELGVRTALGARPVDILTLVVRRGTVLAGTGILAGMIVSAFAASTLASLLYGVRPHDPLVFVTAPLLLLGVALVASYIPAIRATRLDPLIALRQS